MLGKGIFKKKLIPEDQPDAETMQIIFDLVDNSAIPLSGTALHRLAILDATDIDECLQQLMAQDKLEVAYEKNGLDGISRPYYRIAAKYNLLDVKSKVSDFMKAVVKRSKPFVDNGHGYYVKVMRRKELSMIFDRRQDARDYKHLLKESRMKLDSEIIFQEFQDGLQTEERKIS